MKPGGSRMLVKRLFQKLREAYGGLDQIEAVEAASSGPIWSLLRMELNTFADDSDARREIGVKSDTPGFG